MALGLNDVDVEGMKEMDRKIRENPALAKRTVKLRSTWQRGVKALVEIGEQEVLGKPATPPTRRFFVTMDAPAGLGGVDAAFARGDFTGLLGWLREHVYRHGSRYPAARLIEQATGAPPDHQPLVRGLWQRYAPLYGI